MFDWEFNTKAEKEFSKLDATVQKRIIAWLNANIYGSDNPRRQGKALTGDLGNFWRYRIGKYRIIADIQDERFIVTVIKTDKRNDIYKK